jgi:hypothetical protein
MTKYQLPISTIASHLGAKHLEPRLRGRGCAGSEPIPPTNGGLPCAPLPRTQLQGLPCHRLPKEQGFVSVLTKPEGFGRQEARAGGAAGKGGGGARSRMRE